MKIKKNFSPKSLLIITYIFAALVQEAVAETKISPSQSLENYRKAILASNGEVAFKLINRDSVDYYKKVLSDAINAKEKDLLSMQPLERMMILSYRNKLTTKELRSLSPKKLFILSVNEGWAGHESLKKLKTGKVTVKNDKALIALLTKNNKPSPFTLELTNENGWKMNLPKAIEIGNKMIKELCKSFEVKENDLISQILEEELKRPPIKEAWDGPLEIIPKPELGLRNRR